MGLNTDGRGYLENLIDEEISQIPETMVWQDRRILEKNVI